MPQLRFDLTTADWVVFAPLRSLRPRSKSTDPAAAPPASAVTSATCPFCPGNEGMTPREIDAIRVSSGQSSDWQVRVVPNKFPALQIEEDNRRVSDGDVFQQMGGCGAHEVVIESPDHNLFLGSQPTEQVSRVLAVLYRRYHDLMRDRRFQSIIVFKNHGVGAGTSLQHPHWQIIATPVVPRMLRLKHNEAAAYFDRTGRCLYEVLLEQELRRNERVVATNDEFAAVMPFAAHLPFETWILPRRQQASFDLLRDEQIAPLAGILKEVLLKLYVGLENPDFNLTIDTASRGDENEQFFCWHIRILPRLTTAAGFELGSGMSINTVLPEEAAQFLRGGNHAAPSAAP
ncbi:MAG: galactose-1-phosphate uridylyltransferase [Planctomycetaceae bacterium]